MSRSVAFLSLSLFLPILLGAQVPTQLPPRMWADTAHAPFLHGVASGDPTAQSVLLWTRVTPEPAQNAAIPLFFVVALDSALTQVVLTGSAYAFASEDWTVKTEVLGLAPDTRYFYRFSDPQNRFSTVGRTKTFPQGNTGTIKIGVASCSSVYSGYFNAYRRIAERGDLDLMVHLGDYVYDFVDEDEEVRVPVPYPTRPVSVAEWRERHKYYLLDPDLRELRRLQPLSAIWDNHDVLADTIANAVQAFWEFLPIKKPVPNDPLRVYRTIQVGGMADLFLLDVDLYRRQDTLAPGQTSILGNTQYYWLTNALSQSTARWRIMGSQCMFSLWSLIGLPPIFPAGQTVFDPSAWDGYPLDRERLLTHIQSNNIQNCMVISGDAHLSMAADLTFTPLDSTTYDHPTGNGSVGVEFLPSSITRGNLDESGISPANANALAGLSLEVNPHHQYMEVVQHGYGLLTINPDSIIAEFWYSPILQVSNTEVLGRRLVVRNGENRWAREYLPIGLAEAGPNAGFDPLVFPNPVSDGEMWVRCPVAVRGKFRMELIDETGRVIVSQSFSQPPAGGAPIHFVLPEDFSAGAYFLRIIAPEGQGATAILVK